MAGKRPLKTKQLDTTRRLTLSGIASLLVSHKLCSVCGGTGKCDARRCPACRNTGVVAKGKAHEVAPESIPEDEVKVELTDELDAEISSALEARLDATSNKDRLEAALASVRLATDRALSASRRLEAELFVELRKHDHLVAYLVDIIHDIDVATTEAVSLAWRVVDAADKKNISIDHVAAMKRIYRNEVKAFVSAQLNAITEQHRQAMNVEADVEALEKDLEDRYGRMLERRKAAIIKMHALLDAGGMHAPPTEDELQRLREAVDGAVSVLAAYGHGRPGGANIIETDDGPNLHPAIFSDVDWRRVGGLWKRINELLSVASWSDSVELTFTSSVDKLLNRRLEIPASEE